jgi:hypothetical protein
MTIKLVSLEKASEFKTLMKTLAENPRPLSLGRMILGLACAFIFAHVSTAFAATFPVTVRAIRIPAENLAAILPGGLDMETIDAAVMQGIEKAIQLEKAFVEAKWEGNLSKTEPTRIESKEEPVIQFNNTWSMGMNGEIEILESPGDGLAHSCRIRLGFHRKGTLADAKAPNFWDRLARRTRMVSGVFQLADGSHTLLAALPQSPTDEDEHTLLFILSLGKPDASKPPANRPRNGRVTIETFRMPMEDWHRIPQTVRDDYPQLYEKCLAAAGKGKIERIDRISTSATSKDKDEVRCSSVVEISYPTSFQIRDQQLDTKSWEYRMVGSSFEAERQAGADRAPIRISYGMFPQLPMWNPTLKDGSARDVSLSSFPVFGGINFNGSFATEGSSRTCLLGIVPLTAGGEAPTHVALMFASATGPGNPVPETDSQVMVEVLVARGPSGAGAGDAGTHLKCLLARPGSIEAIAAATVVSRQRTVISSAMEWIYPVGILGGGDTIVIPNQFNRLSQGTELNVEYQASTGNDPVSVSINLKHSLHKPELPLATRRTTIHGPNQMMSNLTILEPVTYELKVKETLTLSPGVWTSIKEIPLEPILGADDESAKGQSCHVFVRMVPGNNTP